MKKYLILTFILLVQVSFCQNFNNRLYSYNIESLKYFKYNDLNIYAELKSITDVNNQTPEQLVKSIFSCSNKEWDIKNTLGGEDNIEAKSKEEYLQITKINKNKNFITLLNKVEFKIDDTPTVIIKYYFISEGQQKPQAGIFVMQKIGDFWYKTNTEMVNNIALTILRLKPEILDKLLNNIFDTNQLKNLKEKIFNGKSIDFNKLALEFDSWYQNNTEMLEYFKDNNSIF